MKKITTLVFYLLFLITALISNAQQTFPFSTKDYIFPDGNEMISPTTNYESILIVFSENALDASIVQFEALHPELIQNNNHSFPWHNYKLYTLEQSHRNTAEIAEAYLARHRGNPAISSAYPAFIRNGDTAFLDNQFLLNLRKEDASREKVIKLIKPFKGTVTEELDMIRSTTFAISIPADVNIFTACSELHKLPEVLYAQPNFHFSGTVDFIPNDPMFSDQWFLNQSSDCDIDAVEAWDITTGSASIAVAVIDGHGFDLGHAEMSGKYLSPYNAVDDNNNPAAIESEENHGTPCAGLIGALTNNSVGVASVGYNVMVVPIKIGFDFSGGSFSTSIIILERACEHVMTAPYSIVAVSNSYTMGSWYNVTSVRNAFSNMRTDSRGGLGAVVLASTGNQNTQNIEKYPFRFAHVVGVGSTDRYDSRSSFSNYGDSTDVCAPGTDTWTIDRSGTQGYSFNDYYEFGGTSAACPIAAGIIGLIGSVHPEYTELQLRTQLYNSCEKVGGYSYANNSYYPFGTWSIQLGYGRVNAYQAVLGGGSLLNPPTNLAADVSGNNVQLSWTAPGGGGTQEELIYDNNTTTGAYKYPGYTMSTHMSPTGPCQVLTLKYYTTTESGDNQFYAKVFNWAGGQPGTTVLHNSTEVALDEAWVEIDVSASGINVSGDFLVGFGSFTEQAYLAFDEDLNNGRSWDLQESSQTWDSWNEAYLIRAVVLYPSGKIEVLGGEIPETICQNNKNTSRDEKVLHAQATLPIPNQFHRLLGFLGYKVYRNGTALNSSPLTNTFYDDNGLAAGTYNYTVTAMYDEGESDPAGPVQAVIGGSPFDPPTDLQASVSGNIVTLTWESPGLPGEWIFYHDGTFETSFTSTDGGAGIAQLFTLSAYPVTLNEIRFFTTNYNSWQPMTIYILSGDGNTVLDGPYQTNGVNNNWINIVTSVTIAQSTFMIATYNDIPNGPYVGCDDSFFNETLYFGNHTNGFTELSQLGDYEYIGSHEAKVMYSDKDGIMVTEWISPVNQSEAGNIPDVHRETESLFAAYPEDMLGLLGFNIYRDGTKLNSSPWLTTTYSDAGLAAGTYDYTVTAVYDEGESSAAGPVQATVSGSGLEAPTNLNGSNTDDQISLWWIGPGGSQEELIYDNNEATSAYKYPGYTLSTHMSPSGPCKVLTLKYLTSIEAGNNTFYARVFNWTGTQPGNTLLYENDVTAIEGWLEINVIMENLNVTGDFVVGFGSINEQTFLAFDGNLNNGRSWDREDATSSWTAWNEAYLIRAVVQYGDGSIAELSGSNVLNNLPKIETNGLSLISHQKDFVGEVVEPIDNQILKLLGLLGYNLYRNGTQINSNLILTTNTIDILQTWGNYDYSVTAVYDEGESAYSNTVSFSYYFGVDELEIIDVKIYPNPVHDKLFIHSDHEIKKVKLHTMDGQTIFTEEICQFEYQLDVSNLNAGLYIISIETGKGKAASKILVK